MDHRGFDRAQPVVSHRILRWFMHGPRRTFASGISSAYSSVLAAFLVLLTSAALLATPAVADVSPSGSNSQPPTTQASGCSRPPTDLATLAQPSRIGERVDVVAAVSAVFQEPGQLGGFFIQSGEGTATRGLFVYAPRSAVDAGTRVAFSATIDRYRDRIQLQRPSRVTVCGKVELQPLELRASEDGESFTWQTHGTSSQSADRVASRPKPLDQVPLDVLVRIVDPVVTDVYELGRYGSLRVAPQRLMAATQTAAPNRRAAETLTNGLVIDDGSYRADPRPIPHLDIDTQTRRVGDQLKDITGILTEAFDERRVHPTSPLDTHTHNPRPEGLARSPDTLRIAAFNLENWFTTRGSRGAANAAEIERQLDKLSAAIIALDADILGLIELENRPGAAARLIDRINADLARRDGTNRRAYALVPHPAPGTDAIAVGLIYRPTIVEMFDSRALTHRSHLRTPLLVRFRDGDFEFDVTVVHNRSRSRCPDSRSRNADIDRGAGCWNEQRRTQTDAALRAQAPGHAALIIGDFNAHAFEPPLTLAAQKGFQDLRQEPVETRSTYVFRGRSAQLDYTLGNAAIEQRRSAAGAFAINADEPPFGSYNGAMPFENSAAPYRSSDHDPVWIDLRR
ncbi:MAG: ExeM/NucH family extracellular endonuclease [Thioalkalivibrionaceae bacterium]